MKRLLIAITMMLLAVYGAHTTHASTLSATAPQAVVPADGLATVDVRLDSDGATVNALQATVHYDTSMLEFVSAQPDPSFVSLWTEPAHQVGPGVITMSGGKPNGAFLLDVPIAHLTFRPLKEGAAIVSIDTANSGVYQNDGDGTPTPLSVKSVTLALAGPLHVLAQPISLTHPQSTEWYAAKTFVATWTAFKGYEVTFQLSKDQLSNPDGAPDDNVGTTSYPNLSDGTWYFSFRERLIGTPTWGPVSRRTVLVDATSPEPFDVTSTRNQPGGVGLLSFTAHDATSGVVSYLVRITRKPWWNPWDAKVTTVHANGVLALGDMSDIAEIDVTALDRAGNARTERWFGEHPRRNQLIFMGSLLIGAAVLAGLLLAVVLFTRRITRTPTRSTR